MNYALAGALLRRTIGRSVRDRIPHRTTGAATMSQPAVYASLPAQDAEEAFVLLEDAIGSLAGNQAAMRRLCKVQRYEPLVGWLMYYVDAHTAPQVDAALMWVRSRRHRYHWQGETVALIHEVAAEYLAAYGGQK